MEDVLRCSQDSAGIALVEMSTQAKATHKAMKAEQESIMEDDRKLPNEEND